MSLNFNVSSSISGKKLTSRISHNENFSDEVTYIFFLLKDGVVIERVYLDKPLFEYQLQETGVYLVQAYIKSDVGTTNYRRSSPVTFFEEKKVLEIENHIEAHESSIFHTKLVFKNQIKPFQDFAIITCQDGTTIKNLADIESSTGLTFSKLNSNANSETYILEKSGHVLSCNNSGIFSGLTKYKGKLVVGNDISRDEEKEFFSSLKGNTGCFSYIFNGTDEVRVASDYFGFNRLFYYESDGLFVTSNRYHLLLLSLSKLGISLEIDYKKVWAGLWSFNHQISMQNFSRRMDVQGVYQLDNGKDLVLREGRWKFEDNEFSEVLKSSSDVDFYKALSKAKEEIIEDVNATLDCNEFEKVVIDLSGGLDSRLVYAAATNIEENSEKIRINSKDVPGSSDLDVAIKINNIFKYEFDDTASSKTWVDPKDSDLLMRSFYLGTYFSHNLYISRENNKRKITLNGACGEILARPYLSRNLFGTICDEEYTISGFVKALVSHLGVNSPITGSLSLKYFEELLAEELELIPSKTPYEALDRIYLMYRHGYHFDGGISYGHNGLAWMPLQSKSLFELHHSMYDNLNGLEIQGPLIYHMNPILGGLKYDDDRDNRDINKIQSCFNKIDARFADIDVCLDSNVSHWQKAQVIKSKLTSYENEKPSNLGSLDKEFYKSIFSIVREIERLDPKIFTADIKHSLLLYAMKNKGNRGRIRFMYNKLCSIQDQLHLIS